MSGWRFAIVVVLVVLWWELVARWPTAAGTTLRFDVDSFDRLGLAVEESDPEFDIDDGCPSCSNFGDALALTELALADARKQIADLEAKLAAR